LEVELISRERPWRKLLYKSEPELSTNAIAERALGKVSRWQSFKVSKFSATTSIFETLEL
jgi:hypothetical protein